MLMSAGSTPTRVAILTTAEEAVVSIEIKIMIDKYKKICYNKV